MLDRLLSWMMHSNVSEMRWVARTVRKNRMGIFNYYGAWLANAYLEGANSLIQSIKRAARGSGTLATSPPMVFLRLGGLSFEVFGCSKV